MEPRVPGIGERVSTGTTIVACVFNGGVVLGADTRVTTGTYVSNRVSDKITPLSDNAFLCRSGSAADTQLVSDYVRHFIHQHSMEIGTNPDVRVVAQMCMMMNYQNKGANGGEGLSAAMICAGWDEKRGGQVYSLPIGGTMVPVNWAVDGSGSSFIWGFCDAAYKDNMTRAEAEEFVAKATTLAMSTDGSSGGCVRLVTVTAAGAERTFIPHSALVKYVDELPEPRGRGAVV